MWRAPPSSIVPRAKMAKEGVVDREDWAVHALLGIHTVYARRV
jgi:hypothetical protein